MSEIGKNPEALEMPERYQEVTDYKSIKPEGDMTPKESQSFWDKLFSTEILKKSDLKENKKDLPEEGNDANVDDAKSEINQSDIPEKKGGSYGEVFKEGEGEKYEVHHMPADSVSYLERNDGPAIKMEKVDHRQTASCGSSREAKEYRAAQKELINQGNFREALQMDIDDIHEKFGDKYDDAISEMLDYVDKLESEGKING